MQVQLVSMNIQKDFNVKKVSTQMPYNDKTDNMGGHLEILPNHENMIFNLQNTKIYILTHDDKNIEFTVGNCTIKITDNIINIISDYAISEDKNFKPFNNISESLQKII